MIQVLLETSVGRIWRYTYEAGKPDNYGNSNEPVVGTEDGDGPYCVIFAYESKRI